MKKIIVLASAVLLAGCGADEHSDLKQELNALTKDLRGHVAPLPQVKPYEPVPYTAEALIDPFLPDRIIVAQPGRATGGRGKLAPDPNRPKEPLEAFPLESIHMVGTITERKQTFGLVTAGQNLYRVRKGNYMGQNFGVITSITDGQIDLKELVQDSSGEWVERASALQLQEVSKR
ncbi:MAG TPA: pilus assembly protein PilP [Burkholderiales bacterium]|nr:pilus assembly protein PilP [Burkholderiales bacterium]